MRLFVVLLSLVWALPGLNAGPQTNGTTNEPDHTLLARKLTNTIVLVPGPDDAKITGVVVAFLERSNYLKQRLNEQVAGKFLDRYLNTLDSLHLFFLQSDIEQFDTCRPTLAAATREGDTRLAGLVFKRYIERIHQQYDFATNLLQTERFEFKSEDMYLPHRKDEPRPKDLSEAKKLWRDRLRYEYLQEKLNMGRPDEILQRIREKLDQHKPQAVLGAIQDKLGKEKAQEIARQVEQQAANTPTDAILAGLRGRLEKDNTDEIVKILTRRYTQLLRTVYEYDSDDVLQLYLTALARVYDPHSDYMGHAEKDNFAISMKLSLFGIGALLTSEDGYCKIRSLTPNGPAEKSKKLKPNDKIIAVAQSNAPPVDVIETKLTRVVDMIRGPKGTEVRLTIIPADAPNPSMRKVVTLVRDEIKLEDQAAKAKLYEAPDGSGQTTRLGVIDLPSFYSQMEMDGGQFAGKANGNSTTKDVSRLLKKLVNEKVAGIVLDLRHNGGGFLPEAIRLSGLFVKDGPIVQVKSPDGDVRVEEDPDPNVLYEGPLLVLTSRFSASASEILAGAIQDYGRGVVLGDTSTHGKGTVQTVLELGRFMRGHLALVTSNDPGALKVTVSKFYRPSGASTQLKGVVPDIVLPSVNNYVTEIGESALENPLPWDTIPQAPFTPLNRVEPVLGELRRRSEQRVQSDRDFTYVREEIARYKKMVADKRVSLNEAKRLQEKQELDDRMKARKKELAARPEPPGKVYEITLKQVDEPGLPPPMVKTNALKTASTFVPEHGKFMETAKASRPGEPSGAEPKKPDTAKAPENAPGAPVAQGADSPAAPKDEDSEESLDDKGAPVDFVLDEARHVLLDFLTLSNPGAALAGPADSAPAKK
jgi:carboxyl-terminal processing protease